MSITRHEPGPILSQATVLSAAEHDDAPVVGGLGLANDRLEGDGGDERGAGQRDNPS